MYEVRLPNCETVLYSQTVLHFTSDISKVLLLSQFKPGSFGLQNTQENDVYPGLPKADANCIENEHLRSVFILNIFAINEL